MSRGTVLFFVGISLGLLGCARQVVRGVDHGVVAIPMNTNAWPLRYHDKAARLMEEHFPEGYVVEHEEEVVVGQTEHVDVDETSSTIYERGPLKVSAGASHASRTVSDDREWRIYYHRR